MGVINQQSTLHQFEAVDSEEDLTTITNDTANLFEDLKLRFKSLDEWTRSSEQLLGYAISKTVDFIKPFPGAVSKWNSFLAELGMVIDLETVPFAFPSSHDFEIWSEVSDDDTAAFSPILGEHWPQE
jgi:hypothetical protein